MLLAGIPRLAWAHGPSPPTNASAEPEEAPEQDPEEGIEVVVQADATGGDAASRTRYGRRELDLRPRLRPGDIVEATPGIFAIQHAGGGKANQFFLRGFDADHGTDVRLLVDDIPVNMVSHGHGQGYADLHFLIPELVVGLEGYKGAYYTHLGDFATGGAVEMKLAETFEESFAQVSVGQYGIYRGLGVYSPELGTDWRSVAAAEIYAADGPFTNEEDLIRFNIYGKLTHDFSPTVQASLSWMSYGSDWKGSGQIPARAVCDEGEAGAPAPAQFDRPCLERFGHVDPSEGGASKRHAARLAFDVRWEDADFRTVAYVMRQTFALHSNFTFFRDDPQRGDAIEQTDARWMLGLDSRFRKHFHLGKSVITTSAGLQIRYDHIDNALYHTQRRERLDAKVDATIDQTSIAPYVEADARLTKCLRLLVGLRFDRFDASVTDHLEALNDEGTKTSGTAGDMLVSPKASATVTPFAPWDLFIAYGRGFHSNDARGSVRSVDTVDLLTVAKTYEAGTRVRPVPGLSLDAAFYLTDLDSEIVWVGDEGTTEASSATRRFGVEVTGRYKLKDWLFADAAFTWNRARYTGASGGDAPVALAPIVTFSTGIGLRPTFGDFTPFLGTRLKAIADRPAIEDESLVADGFWVVDLNAGLRWRDLEAAVDIQNLFDVDWREVSFATESRLPYEPASVLGIHYAPGWPFTAIGRVSCYFR